jgi:hypothetical protein
VVSRETDLFRTARRTGGRVMAEETDWRAAVELALRRGMTGRSEMTKAQLEHALERCQLN